MKMSKLKLLIAVPSRNRYRENEILKNTWSWLQHSKYDHKVFVEPHEYGFYKDAIGEGNIIKLGEDNAGLGYCKLCIQQYARENRYDLIMKIDDDTSGWYDYKNGWYRYYKKTNGVPMSERRKAICEDIFDRVVEDTIELMEYSDQVGGVGYPGGGSMFHEPGQKWLKFNGRFLSPYTTRTELFCPPRSRELSQFEDFYTQYNILRQGKFTAFYGLAGYCDGGGEGKNKGGFQDFDRMKLSDESRKIAEEIWPNELHYKIYKEGQPDQYMGLNIPKIKALKLIPVPEDVKKNLG